MRATIFLMLVKQTVVKFRVAIVNSMIQPLLLSMSISKLKSELVDCIGVTDF